MEFWFKFYVSVMLTLAWLFVFITWATAGLGYASR